MDIFDYSKILATLRKFDKVDNTSDLDKPVSRATQAAIDAHIFDYTELNNRTLNVDNTSDLNKPISLLAQAEFDSINSRISNVDNTSDLDKPISRAVQAALDLKEGESVKYTAFNKDFGTTAGTVCEGNDPRLSDSRVCNNTFDDVLITKTNLSLQNVDNTRDADKPASTVVQAELDSINSRISNVDNTSDLNKPISLATQTALDGKEPAFVHKTAFNRDFGNAVNTVCMGNDPRLSDSRKCNSLFDNIVGAKTTLLLEKVNNTSDIDKPISALTQIALNTKQDVANAVRIDGIQTITSLKDFTVRPTVNGYEVWDKGNLVPGIWWTQIWGGNTVDLEWTLETGTYAITFETFDSTTNAVQPIHKPSVLIHVQQQGHLCVSQMTTDVNPSLGVGPWNGDRFYVVSEGWRVKGYFLQGGTTVIPTPIREIWKAT